MPGTSTWNMASFAAALASITARFAAQRVAGLCQFLPELRESLEFGAQNLHLLPRTREASPSATWSASRVRRRCRQPAAEPLEASCFAAEIVAHARRARRCAAASVSSAGRGHEAAFLRGGAVEPRLDLADAGVQRRQALTERIGLLARQVDPLHVAAGEVVEFLAVMLRLDDVPRQFVLGPDAGLEFGAGVGREFLEPLDQVFGLRRSAFRLRRPW